MKVLFWFFAVMFLIYKVPGWIIRFFMWVSKRA